MEVPNPEGGENRGKRKEERVGKIEEERKRKLLVHSWLIKFIIKKRNKKNQKLRKPTYEK